jgi:hypothetical protein
MKKTAEPSKEISDCEWTSLWKRFAAQRKRAVSLFPGVIRTNQGEMAQAHDKSISNKKGMK